MNITIDIANETIDFDISEVSSFKEFFYLFFCFRNNGSKRVQFNNLKFSYSFSASNEEIFSNSYPEVGNAGYVSSDQEFLESDSIYNLRPDVEYTIKVFVENNGSSYSSSVSFNMPKPKKPYDSWIWNKELALWDPPFFPPEDGNSYVWHEKKNTWILEVL